MKKVEIQIFSDIICPWCFIGRAKLIQALEKLKGKYEFKIEWLPFELNPDMPKEGMDRKTYRSKKFGSWERSQEMDATVERAGREVGISFRYDLAQKTPNTLAGHRLIWLAQREGAGDYIAEAIFRAYFTEGKDIGDLETLVTIAGQSGMNVKRVRDFLSSDEGLSEVRALEREALYEAAVKSVPHIIINHHLVVTGAQSAQDFVDAIEFEMGEQK